MNTLSFPFTTGELTIAINSHEFKNRINKLEEQISEIIEDILYDFDPTNSNSTLGRFHNSDLGFPVTANTTFLDFLAINIEYAELTKGKFNPFLIESELSLEDVLEMSHTSKTVIRFENLRLKTTLLTPFVVDILHHFLQEQRVQEFLISTDYVFRSHGSDRWEIKFPHPLEDTTIDMTISEESAVMSITPNPQKRVVSEEAKGMMNPFQHVPLPLVYLANIVEAPTAIGAKVIGEVTMNTASDSQLQNIAKDWQCGLTLFRDDGEYVQFHP